MKRLGHHTHSRATYLNSFSNLLSWGRTKKPP